MLNDSTNTNKFDLEANKDYTQFANSTNNDSQNTSGDGQKTQASNGLEVYVVILLLITIWIMTIIILIVIMYKR